MAALDYTIRAHKARVATASSPQLAAVIAESFGATPVIVEWRGRVVFNSALTGTLNQWAIHGAINQRRAAILAGERAKAGLDTAI